MSNPEEYKLDRSKWPAGPWDAEPFDRQDFKASGFPCFIQRNPFGAWCGYVGVPPEHPKYACGYSRVAVEVHGDLTYADKCTGHICHTPAPGDPDDVWWFGFDCAHGGDDYPEPGAASAMLRADPFSMVRSMLNDGNDDLGGWGEYRTAEYARAETERLAEQLRRLA